MHGADNKLRRGFNDKLTSCMRLIIALGVYGGVKENATFMFWLTPTSELPFSSTVMEKNEGIALLHKVQKIIENQDKEIKDLKSQINKLKAALRNGNESGHSEQSTATSSSDKSSCKPSAIE